MNILWIPHDAWGSGGYRRDQHIIKRLKKRHKIVVLTWEGVRKRNFIGYINYLWKTFVPSVSGKENVKIYKMVKFPTPGTPWKFPHAQFRELNQLILNSFFQFIVKREKIDLAITGPNAAFVGYLRAHRVPVIFDLLDCSDWSFDNPWMRMEKEYFIMSDGVLAVSPFAKTVAKKFNKNVFYLPNGVEIEKFQIKSKSEAKRSIGLDGKKVITIIGPTFSMNNPFMEAIMGLVERNKNIIFMIVGENEKVNKLKLRYNHPSVKYCPYVSYEYIHDYFIASDIGLYPAENTAYYHCAIPLKVLEYSAARSWVVVSPRLYGVASLKLPNVVFCNDDKQELEMTMAHLLNRVPPDATNKLIPFHWDILAEQLEGFLMSIIKG